MSFTNAAKLRKASGLCVDCGDPRPPELSWYCRKCQNERSVRIAARVKRVKAEGKCVICGNPRPPELKCLCRSCQDTQTSIIVKYHNAKVKEGKCRTCGKMRDGTSPRYCVACTIKRKEQARQIRTKNKNLDYQQEINQNKANMIIDKRLNVNTMGEIES